MKTWLIPSLVALLSTGLCAWCCHLSGLPRQDVWIAALVAFVVSVSTVVTTVLVVGMRSQPPATKP